MQRKNKLNEKNNIVSTHAFDLINIIFNYLNKYINYNFKANVFCTYLLTDT